jgi:hypothetical protein
MNDRSVLIIFSKIPLPGKTKTRLTRLGLRIAPEFSAELHKSFLLDILDLASSLCQVDIFLACWPSNSLELFRSLVKQKVEFIPQVGEDLGSRMHNAFVEVFSRGYERMLLIGSDSPTIQRRHLEEAFDMLEEDRVVIGPSVDGGYYLVGLRKPFRGLFLDISWGTPAVLAQTLKRIREHRLDLVALDPWYDVDTPEDLKFLSIHLDYLKTRQDAFLPGRTIELLNTFFKEEEKEEASNENRFKDQAYPG